MSRRNIKAVEDADVVMLLKKAGGILVAVTNIPEYNLWVETRNNVYGQTLNPYNTTRTVGGSSGGEVRRTIIIIIITMARQPYMGLGLLFPRSLCICGSQGPAHCRAFQLDSDVTARAIWQSVRRLG
jgi:hypothetical protein